jgi:hypothetical protein
MHVLGAGGVEGARHRTAETVGARDSLVLDPRVTNHVSALTSKSAMSDTLRNDKSKQIRHLRELIAALDRRVPRIERAGEAQIARDAAALKKKALGRLAELEADVER